MRIEEIAKETNFADEGSVDRALKKMRAVSDHDLHLFLVMRDTLNATTSDTRRKIALAQCEQDRRIAAKAMRLSRQTTVISGVIGLAGVILGAYLRSVFSGH